MSHRKKHRIHDPDRTLRVDPRIPFAICAADGLVLLGLYTLLHRFSLERPFLTGMILLGVYVLTAGGTFLTYVLHLAHVNRRSRAVEKLNTDIYRMFRSVIDIPYAVVNAQGNIRVINTAMQEILGCRSPVCEIPLSDICPTVTREVLESNARNPGEDTAAVRAEDPLPPEDESFYDPFTIRETAASGMTDPIVRLSNGRRYRVEVYLLRQGNEQYHFLIFRDVNDYLDFVDETNRNHVVVAYIMLDNLQELTQFVRANYRATATVIEEALTRWVSSLHGVIHEIDRDRYMALFSEEMLDACVKTEFPILNEIMNIRVGDNTFPLSLSMGIADVDGTMEDREKAASNALDMALQRGGNQVALARRGVIGLTYFGGTHKMLEGNTSISSRVSVHLLERRMAQCDNVLIMAHSNPDFDAIGSAVGAGRLCRSILAAAGRADVPVHIITNKTCDTFKTCAQHLRTLPEYEEIFIDKDTAQAMINTRTMLILTDVSNPAIFEAPGLIRNIPEVDGTSAIAVIDHHRLAGELPFVPFLHFIETTKSSASEIIAEMLEQSAYADTLLKEEANLLLAGIMLDTHNFTRSAGAQTFGVTYYLYGRNAHTDVAREFFNERMDELQVASEFDANTHMFDRVFAITWLNDDHVPAPDDRIAASKAADRLLSLRNVEASFALASTGTGVAISGRSKGRINVQLILEKLDGGGHFDMAGAQVAGSIRHAVDLLCRAITDYHSQFPEQFKGHL